MSLRASITRGACPASLLAFCVAVLLIPCAPTHAGVPKLMHRTVLPSTQEALELLSAGYRAGRFRYLDYLEGQRSALEAEILAIDAAQSVWSARMTLERLVGHQTDTESLPQEER